MTDFSFFFYGFPTISMFCPVRPALWIHRLCLRQKNDPFQSFLMRVALRADWLFRAAVKQDDILRLQWILGLYHVCSCLAPLSHRFQYRVCLHTNLPPLSHNTWKPYRNTSGIYSILWNPNCVLCFYIMLFRGEKPFLTLIITTIY